MSEERWAVTVTWLAPGFVELEARKGTRVTRMTMTPEQAERLGALLQVAGRNAALR